MRAALPLLLLLFGLASRQAQAQLAEETVVRTLDLKREPAGPKGPYDVSTHKGRYAFEVACFQRLLPLDATLRRCVDSQRMSSGEFHGRLDFSIEPSGKLTKFESRWEQLQACLMPHALGLKFPKFSGQPSYLLQVLVASPGVQLGRRVAPKPVAVYPIGTEEEQRAYRMAMSWVFSPWSQAVSHCAELTDQLFGFGYQVRLAVGVTPTGRPASASLELHGKLAARAIGGLVGCVTPFVRSMTVPPHAGSQPFIYRFGSNTAGWGIR